VTLWVRPLFTSFWVDEFGSWWVINGSFHDVITRTEAVQGQSPLYFIALWLTKGVLGHSEAALRLPSLVCVGISAFLIYRIAERLADRETARLAVVAFAVWPQIVFAASDARPYAMATVLAIGAAWAWIRWLDDGGRVRATVAVVLAALVPYAHPLAAPVLAPLALYAASRVIEGSTGRSVRSLVLAAIAVLVLIVPVAIEVLRLTRRQGDWEVPNQPSVSWVVAMLMPAAFAFGVLVTLVLARWASTAHDPRSLPRSTLVLVLGWFLIPAAVLVALAIFTPVQLISFRYFIVAAPAGALIAGALGRAIEPPRIRRIVVAAVVVASVLELATPFKSGDMRGALAIAAGAADAHTVTLVRSGFQESLQMSWYTDPVRSGFLTAATSYYPIPGEVMPISVDLTPEMAAFTKERIDEAIPSTDKFLAVTVTGSPFEPWLNEVFEERGYTSTVLGQVNLFTVTEFTRQPS
jgi:mannosyltransferase